MTRAVAAVLLALVAIVASRAPRLGYAEQQPSATGCDDALSFDPTENSFVVDDSGPREDATHSLKDLAGSVSLANPANYPRRPEPELIDWGADAKGFVKPADDACSLDESFFSRDKGRIFAIARVANDSVVLLESYVWIDRRGKNTAGEYDDSWRMVLINIRDISIRKLFPLALSSPGEEWPQGYNTHPGAWARTTGVAPYDRLQVKLGPNQHLATTGRIAPPE